jgi:hypothetical protein
VEGTSSPYSDGVNVPSGRPAVGQASPARALQAQLRFSQLLIGSRPLAWIRRPKSPRPAIFRDMPDRSRSGVSPGTKKYPYIVVDPGDGSPHANLHRAAISTAHRSGLPERSAARPFQPGRYGRRFAAWRCDAVTGAGAARRPASEAGRGSVGKHPSKDCGISAGVLQPRACDLPYVRQRTDRLQANPHKSLTGQKNDC